MKEYGMTGKCRISKARAIMLGLCSVVASLGFSQSKITLQFLDAGRREVWIAPKLPDGVKPTSTESEAKKLEVSISEANKAEKIFVWDRTSGNVAVKPVQDILTSWEVKPAEYKYIGVVRVSVQSQGKPVRSASVTLSDSKRSQMQLLDSTTKGVLEFYCVFPGDIKITTTYKADGKTREPDIIMSQIALKRDNPDRTIAVNLPDKVDTISVKDSETGESEKSEAEREKDKERSTGSKDVEVRQPNRIGQFVVMIIVLVAAGALVYFAIQFFKNNEARVKQHLQSMGVQIPDPSDPNAAATAPAPVAPVAPQPQQQIVLGGADPTPISTPYTPQAASPTPTGTPRLIAENGTVFDLRGGTSIVSRDPDGDIVLLNEGSVSRKHAEVTRNGTTVTVKDLGSTNGTYVNGVKIIGDTVLEIGDRVQFGTIRLRYEG
jgi:hypothetical protein